MWLPELGTVGEGGCGSVSQSVAATGLNFVFKRFHGAGDSENYYAPLISEVMIVSQLPIRDHPNIIDLEGICWEVRPTTKKRSPCLCMKGQCGIRKSS